MAQRTDRVGPRMLRVGVLLNRALVEEKQFVHPTEVTMGHSLSCTFAVPAEGMPRSFSVFTVKDGHYWLHFTDQMDGRLSNGGTPLKLSELTAQATRVGDHWALRLSDNARGKLELGDMTMLFQLVAPPPPLPKIALPLAVRGSMGDRIDSRLATIVVISLALHMGVAVYAGWFADPPGRKGLAAQAYQLTFKPEEVALIEPQPIEDKGDTGATDGAEKKVEVKKPSGGDKKPGPAKDSESTGGGRDVDSAAALQQQAAALAMILTSGDEDPFGVGGGDAKRSPGGDLGRQLEQLGDRQVGIAVGGQSGRGTRDGGARVGTGSGPNLSGGQTGIASAGDDKVEKAPSGRISVSDKKAFDQTTLSPDAVLAKIRSVYMSALQRCYKDHLKSDPSARGKVALSFTVNEKGRAVSNSAKGFAGDVDSCIASRMASWTFPVPKDSDGEATDASFSISLQFVPE